MMLDEKEHDKIPKDWSEAVITVEYNTPEGLKNRQVTFNRAALLKERKDNALKAYQDALLEAPNRAERRKLEVKNESVLKEIQEMTLEDFEQRVMQLAEKAWTSPVINMVGDTIHVFPLHQIVQVIIAPTFTESVFVPA